MEQEDQYQAIKSNANTEPPPPKPKPLSIFQEINPETNCTTAFQKKLPYAGGETNLNVTENTPQEVIDREVSRNMANRFQSRFGTIQPTTRCFKIMQRANPKGVLHICEMCPDKATLCCSKCTVAYYCCWTHRELDKLHDMMCSRLKAIRWPPPHFDDSSSRKRCDAQKLLIKEKLLEDILRQAFINLYEDKFIMATCALSQCLNYVTDVFGPDNDDLHKITLFTALTEAHIGQSELSTAEKSMNNALVQLWKVEEKKSNTDRLNYARAMVSKVRGLLGFVKKDFKDSIFYFADFIYHISEATGPTDVRTCTGYFYLAKSFLASNMLERGFAILLFCVNLWQNYLEEVFRSETESQQRNCLIGMDEDGNPVPFIVELEATQQLKGLGEIVKNIVHPEIAGRTVLCKGILFYLKKKYSEARKAAWEAMDFESSIPDGGEFLLLCRNLEKYAARKDLGEKALRAI